MKQLQFLLTSTEEHREMSGPCLLKLISVLDVIYWEEGAWSEADISTIQKCFHKCGLQKTKQTESSCSQSEDNADLNDDLPLAVFELSHEIFVTELVKIDREVIAHDTQMMTDWSMFYNDSFTMGRKIK